MPIWLDLINLAFLFYAFFDCARTDQDVIRKGPKWAWLIGILLFESIAGIAWFIWGRPNSSPRGGRGKRKIIPPDDDPDFLRKI